MRGEAMDSVQAGYLGSLPVDNPERPKLRDQVPGSPERLAARAAKYLTLSPEYRDGANTAFWNMVNDTRTRYPRYPRCHPTRQLPCKPFESGKNVLPGMEAFA